MTKQWFFNLEWLDSSLLNKASYIKDIITMEISLTMEMTSLFSDKIKQWMMIGLLGYMGYTEKEVSSKEIPRHCFNQCSPFLSETCSCYYCSTGIEWPFLFLTFFENNHWVKYDQRAFKTVIKVQWIYK